MPINTGSFAKALWPGINAWYGATYNEWPTQYTAIFDEEKSSKAYEEEVGISGFGLAGEKGEGAEFIFDDASQGFTTRYLNKTYALGYIITQEMIEDNQYDLTIVGKKEAKGLAFSMRQTKEILAANVLNRAFNTSYTFGDGKALCVSDHPTKVGGTFSNVPTVAADLSEAALEQACIDIMGFTNDRGLKIHIKPKRLIIPKELTFEAARILKSVGQNDTANNAINALKDAGMIPEVVANVYLTDPDAWFIKTDCPEGLKYFNRVDNEFGMDNDFNTTNIKFRARFRCSFGATDPRGLYSSAGS